MIVVFPWPPRELSPNARVHWAKKSKAAKAYKTECWYACKSEIDGWYTHERVGPKKHYTHLKITFAPPSARRADIDNMLSQFKLGIDAISEVTGVDDSKFTITISKDNPVKGGSVSVILSEAA